MQRLKPVDVVIAGGGWSGLLMAKELVTRTSLSVVVLERGPARTQTEYLNGMDELDYNLRFRMMQSIADDTVTHRHSPKGTAVPVRQYGSFNPGTGTGGAGEHWSGLSYRYLPEQFRLASHLREKHGAAALPADLSLQDWGVTYDEVEPYYRQAELLMGVSGKAGNMSGQIKEGGNVFEAPRKHEYPNPPHKISYLGTLFDKAAKELGYHPYPVPAATLSQAYTNPDGVSRAGCAYCGFCTRYGCMIGAKAQPTNTLMPVLRKHNRFTLRNGCWVRRVIHKDGRATGVTYMDAAGNEVLQPAHIVISASFTLSNTRLLSLSGIGETYNPETGKGTLGKNLTHQMGTGTSIYLDKPVNAFMGAGALAIGISDFEGDLRPEPVPGMLRGFTIRASSPGQGPIAAWGGMPPGTTRAAWGAEWKKAALQWYDRTAEVRSEGEHLAYRHNFFDLDPTYTDKFGDPLLRMTLDWTEHERIQSATANRIQERIGKQMGALAVQSRAPYPRYSVTTYQSSHIQGGTVMGTSPETSVVNPWLQHWRLQNLFVLGASTFSQNPSGNPTLTVLALTWRTADAIVNRYLKKPGALA